jgi:hypothetical protein
MGRTKLVSREKKHYLVKRQNQILNSKLNRNQLQAEPGAKFNEADEVMLFRGVATDSSIQVNEHSD